MFILDFLFALIIAPLRGGMDIVLGLAHSITDSWGWSIVLLSMAVNIALIPVYHLAESWQEDERYLQKRMAGKLAEIKSEYAGRERYMFTRAVYRMFGYHPMMALRTSLGLLIQIPFFFAAYNLLHGNAALGGVSFFFIADLGRPDAMLALGGMSLNLLPFVMTAVNLVSAAVYSSRLTRRDKIQLYALAALFLLLLYTASAGLLLYWTCNNIFSLGKNIFYKRYIYDDSGRESPLARLREATQALWAGFMRRLGALTAKADLVLLPLAIAFCVAAESIYKKQPLPGLALISAAFLLVAFAALCRAASLRARCRGEEAPAPVGYFALLMGILVFFAILGMHKADRHSATLLWVYLRFYAGFFAFATGWLFMRQPIAPFLTRIMRGAERKLKPASSLTLFALSSLLVALLIFIYTPLNLYSSDPEFFTEKISALMGNLSFRALVFMGLLGLAWHYAQSSVRPIMALFMNWAAFGMLIYVFVATSNYGGLDQTFFQDPDSLRNRLGLVIDPAVLTASGLLIFALLQKVGARSLVSLVQALCLALILASGYKLLASPDVEEYVGSTSEPEFSQRLWSFSPSGKNVIILMLDGFTGGLADEIFEANPELAARFDGFTLYSENMAPGARTMLTIPAMLGGARYTPSAINARKPKSILDEMHEGFAELPRRLLEKDYDVSLAAAYLLQTELLAEHMERADEVQVVGYFLPSTYVPMWRKLRGLPEVTPPSRASFMASAGLLYAAPWSLRSNIYSSGRWMNTQSDTHQNLGGIGDLAILDMLPRLSNTEARKENTFKFVSIQVKYLVPMCEETRLPASDGECRGKVISGKHFSLAAIADWLDWLKAQELYDNTQIIMVADHGKVPGPRFPASAYKRFEDPSIDGIWRPHGLLMVKNFGSHGSLAIDRRLSSVEDIVPFIATENGLGQIHDYKDFLNDPNPDQERLRTHDGGSGGIRRHKKDKYIILHHEVRGDMFNLDNWKRVGGSNE